MGSGRGEHRGPGRRGRAGGGDRGDRGEAGGQRRVRMREGGRNGLPINMYSRSTRRCKPIKQINICLQLLKEL